MNHSEIIIIGGGLAGLTAGIHLSKLGRTVLLFEKNDFPKHKVCGEYISNEVLPYFDFLEIDLSSLSPVNIAKTELSTVSGKSISAMLPLGGFGVSRYALDHLLYQKALANGCKIIIDAVINIEFHNDKFAISTAENQFQSDLVIGAFGKRSAMDQKLHRNFIDKKSPWLAVKAHYTGVFPNNLVALHNFRGGYCGVSNVENNAINICYLANYESFKKYKNLDEYQEKVLFQNPHLKKIFENSQLLFDKPITISQISFERKNPVDNHILMVGDTAGLIHPLCGNGMAMAIHSAKIAVELIVDYKNGVISRIELEKKYTEKWQHHFSQRIRIGRFLAALLQNEWRARIAMKVLLTFPFLLPKIIQRTHGKPLITTA